MKHSRNITAATATGHDRVHRCNPCQNCVREYENVRFPYATLYLTSWSKDVDSRISTHRRTSTRRQDLQEEEHHERDSRCYHLFKSRVPHLELRRIQPGGGVHIQRNEGLWRVFFTPTRRITRSFIFLFCGYLLDVPLALLSRHERNRIVGQV